MCSKLYLELSNSDPITQDSMLIPDLNRALLYQAQLDNAPIASMGAFAVFSSPDRERAARRKHSATLKGEFSVSPSANINTCS